MCNGVKYKPSGWWIEQKTKLLISESQNLSQQQPGNLSIGFSWKMIKKLLTGDD